MREHRRVSLFFPILLSLLLCCCGFFLYNTSLASPNLPTREQRTLALRFSSSVPDEGTFVTRSGSSLVLRGNTFRFSGPNIYWLGLLQTPNGITYPSQFEVDDAMATAAEMGATVVRSHTLGASVGCGLCIEPKLGTFNQQAFQHIDYAIQAARSHNIKLIIPLTDNWDYYSGGKATFTTWRNFSDEHQFYTNPQVIADFEQYINTILNHINRYSGIAYKDDPTIMAWETGNELWAPRSWVQTISQYIKSIDPHHLVMDGNDGDTKVPLRFQQDLNIQSIDIYTGHFYPPDVSLFTTQLNQALGAKKAYMIGEFDWNIDQGTALHLFLPAIEHSGAAGDLYWSLFPHDDQHGFVPEDEHFTLHYPGDTPDVRDRVQELVNHAYAMQGLSVPSQEQPGQPLITSIQGKAIAWRGAHGAYEYTVERSTQGAGGPWTVICNQCVTDNDPPWVDQSRPVGSVWYRVRGYNMSGVAGAYSDVYLSAG
jgi:mannan endo-1,4-beta-mannosidase